MAVYKNIGRHNAREILVALRELDHIKLARSALAPVRLSLDPEGRKTLIIWAKSIAVEKKLNTHNF